MKHLKNALSAMEVPVGNEGHGITDFIKVDGNQLLVTIQDGPIKEVGVNGCQVSHLLEFTRRVFESLNADFPCRENALTITKLEEGEHWQEARTRDRERRGVEGKNKA